MKSIYAPLITGLVMFNLGCTKGKPDFASLGGDGLPQPMFSGSTQTSLTATTPAQTFSISGDCDPKIQDIAGQAVGTASIFATLAAMSTTAVTVDCANSGHFSFTLKSLSDLGYTPVNGKTYDIELRAITVAGVSNPSTIHILYSPGAGPDPKRLLITSGSTLSGSGARLSTGSNYKAEIRIGTRQAASTGATYQLRSGLSSQ